MGFSTLGGLPPREAGSVEAFFLATLGAPADFAARVTFARSFFEAGGIEAVDSGLAGNGGNAKDPLAEAFVERSILVSDDDIVAAQKALWNRARIISEPGGAAAFAAILSGRYAPAPGERVAVLVCGANANPANF